MAILLFYPDCDYVSEDMYRQSNWHVLTSFAEDLLTAVSLACLHDSTIQACISSAKFSFVELHSFDLAVVHSATR